jgi:hypothetical protein
LGTTEAPYTTTEVIITTEAPICAADGVYNIPFEGNCSLVRNTFKEILSILYSLDGITLKK